MTHFYSFTRHLRKLAGLSPLWVAPEAVVRSTTEPVWITPAYLRRSASGAVQRLY